MANTAVYTLYIDWENTFTFAGDYDNVSADVQPPMKWQRGKDNQLGHAQAGILEVILRDPDGKYSPENAAGVLYGKLLPHRAIGLQATFGGDTHTLYLGYINKIIPHPHWDKQNCYIYAMDGLNDLIRGTISTKVYLPSCEFYDSGDDGRWQSYADNPLAQSFTPQGDQIVTGVEILCNKDTGG